MTTIFWHQIIVVNVRVNISYKPSNERNISKVLTAQHETFIIGYREQISDAMWLHYFWPDTVPMLDVTVHNAPVSQSYIMVMLSHHPYCHAHHQLPTVLSHSLSFHPTLIHQMLSIESVLILLSVISSNGCVWMEWRCADVDWVQHCHIAGQTRSQSYIWI